MRAELGSLEAEILRRVWEMGEVAVDEVHKALAEQREIAYTTVMTVMSRMAKKGLLKRRKEGRAYLYQAAIKRSELARSSLSQWAERFFDGQVVPAVAFMLGQATLSAQEIDELKELLDTLSSEDSEEREGKGEGEGEDT